MNDQEVYMLVAATSMVLLILLITVIILFVFFQKRKLKFILEKKEAEKRYMEEIAKSQIEIQEQALQNMSWELHDNIGQLLSVARMHINILGTQLREDNKEKLDDISEIVGKSLQEIRLLSKTMNTEIIQNMGLIKSIEVELERFNKLNFLAATLEVSGEERSLDVKEEIILFRILQEFFSNAIKHSKAKNLAVNLTFAADQLVINAQDDGVGFDEGEIEKGSGLINMKSRAAIINAEFAMKSAKNKGVSLTLAYPYKEK
ncbi:oxygen sensor histidine kinase NreB [Kordia sp. SMS9]|uniref:sensor histidine kinase n=1 Tax=Kordia sp. SMS9 TaxID=2282170 RepID=UPI000E0D1455|nr:histidine kinase [Kordia sp. SMS9]AXG71484.1 oxygen sensor histidine kinase NreB [Kordia sp. SMS9]